MVAQIAVLRVDVRWKEMIEIWMKMENTTFL